VIAVRSRFPRLTESHVAPDVKWLQFRQENRGEPIGATRRQAVATCSQNTAMQSDHVIPD